MRLMGEIEKKCSLAIICDSLPPYRIHFHRRIVNELPWLKLWTINTHEGDDGRWQAPAPADINPVDLAAKTWHRHGMNWASWKTGGRIIEWLKDNPVSAVMVLGYNDAGRLRIFRWCTRHGLPVFVWGDSNVRGDAVGGVRRIIKNALVGWVLRHTTAAMCCGSMGRAFYERYGADPRKIHYLPYEPDYRQIMNVPPRDVDAALTQFGIPRSRRRMVFSGRLARTKRPDLLVRSFVDIADQRPEWDLVLIGDGDLRETLQRMVPDRLRARIYMTGFVADQAVIAALYRGSDLLVLPSNEEPWALVINEAAAAGLAIVCTDVVGAGAELVVEGVNGFRVPPDRQEALTVALLKATDPAAVDRLKNASSSVLEAWRRSADPVDGLCHALELAGVCAAPQRT